jgi:hypothetical protein
VNRMKSVLSSLVVLAVCSTAACSATADIKDQMEPASKPAPAGAPAAPKLVTDTAPGGSEVGSKPAGSDSDEATQVHMEFTNNTGQELKLISSSRGGGTAHWETQPPATLAIGEQGFASSYAASNAQINLTYQGVDDGVSFYLFGETPTVGSNKVSGSANSASYTVTASAGSGYNPTDSYKIQPGGAFTFSGQDQQYTVPAGVTALSIEATGGGASAQGALDSGTAGAIVTGTLAVTPGQVLTIGVGGQGGTRVGGLISFAGGWGPTIAGDSYRGGNSTEAADELAAIPGGGATVISDQASGTVLAVAGGAGGDGLGGDIQTMHPGGYGGANGQWSGGNGDPYPGGGGQAGANTSTQGQDSTAGDNFAGGAGGGGVKGGMAGADGGGAGGGAGSSAAPGLTNTAVKAGSNNGGSQKDGLISITAAGS